MTETPGTSLTTLAGEDGLTHHQTTPLRRHGVTTVEQLAELVDAHRANPDDSALSQMPGLGRTRIERVCAVIDQWRTDVRGGQLDAPDVSVGAGSVRA
jgi:hypothetical protein